MNGKNKLHQFELSKLKNATDNVIHDRQLSEGFKNNIVKGVTDKLDNVAQPLLSSDDYVKKIANLRALKKAGQKVAGIIPFAGAAMGLASGDPAYAAEEALGDVPVIGQAFEALKPEDAGNRDEERQMLMEHKARQNYENSPAAEARRKALMRMAES